LASVCLFDFRITPAFVLGSSTVLVATWMYNRSQGDSPQNGVTGRITPFPGSPVPSDSPILGQVSAKKRSSLVDLSPRAIAVSLGLSSSSEDLTNLPSKTSGQRFTVQGNGNGSLSARTPYVASRTPPISRSQTPYVREDRTYLR
jgi:UDP-sugar transporter A1/2/3